MLHVLLAHLTLVGFVNAWPVCEYVNIRETESKQCRKLKWTPMDTN